MSHQYTTLADRINLRALGNIEGLQSGNIYHWANDFDQASSEAHMEVFIGRLLQLTGDKTPFPVPQYSKYFSLGFYAARAQSRGADPEKIRTLILLLFG